MALNLPYFDGWRLIGTFPDGEPDAVGSWLLVHDGEAMLLEVPEGLTVEDVESAVEEADAALCYATASHDHYDHLDPEAWDALAAAFPEAQFLPPAAVHGDCLLHIGDEPVWLIKAPKHSTCDVVTVFRGVAMTGDLELGTLESVTDEVPLRTKRKSMDWLRGFQERAGYHVNSIVSAHLNDVRTSIHWPDLFRCEDVKQKARQETRKRTVCRRCGGELVPTPLDGAGHDRKCKDCGRPEWSDPRKL